jgi:2-polyprenyl-3-methyl-5-hydroxy-6-metoxy-1,4-benzoquinol methylase
VRKYMLGRKRRLVEKATSLKTGQILDVGTGTGFFLNEMNENGWRVTGTEKSGEAREFAKKEFNLDNLPSEKLFNLKDKSFDVITLWHVLEHIHLLNENMATLHRLLKKRETDNCSTQTTNLRPMQNTTNEFWAAFDVPRHIWHFAPKQMKIVGEKHGFKLISTIHYNAIRFVLCCHAE